MEEEVGGWGGEVERDRGRGWMNNDREKERVKDGVVQRGRRGGRGEKEEEIMRRRGQRQREERRSKVSGARI